MLSMLRLPLLLAATAGAHRVERPALPAGWRELELRPADRNVWFSVALAEPNRAEVERIALDVSDPASPQYGQHLLQAELDALTQPTAADASKVRAWLLQTPGCSTPTAGARAVRLLHVTCSVAAASQLLQTSFRTVERAATGQRGHFHRPSRPCFVLGCTTVWRIANALWCTGV